MIQVSMLARVCVQETTSSLITWALAYLIRYPNVQARMQEELDEVIGSGRVTMAERSALPYTTATLNEVYRYVYARLVGTVCLHYDALDVRIQLLRIFFER